MTREDLCRVLYILETHTDRSHDNKRWRSDDLEKLTELCSNIG